MVMLWKMAIFFPPFSFVLLAIEWERGRDSFSIRKSFELKIHVEDNINTKCKQSSGYITQIIKNEIFNST